MTFTVNGVDMTPYIKYKGLKWQRNDIDGDNAGRSLDAAMMRDRIAIKISWDVTCRPLTTSEAQIVLNAIKPEYVTATTLDPQDGLVTRTFYSNNNPASYMMLDDDGIEYWDGISFPLIEV